MEALAGVLLVATILVYTYLAIGVLFAMMIYFGMLKRDTIRFEQLDLIDPDFRWKLYIYIAVNWYKIISGIR